ncbi:unannotated protein [freshwater metagenome]|uniref:Unannotated protein n=1 Tax=freshwater metagenome TaxID=449393 RepID=A0A6J7FAM5_9ZZZZ
MTIDRVQTTPIDLTDHHCQAGVDPTTLQLQLGEQRGEFTQVATRYPHTNVRTPIGVTIGTTQFSTQRHGEHDPTIRKGCDTH